MNVRRLILALVMGTCACINVDLRLYETQLRASVIYPDPAASPATLHVEVHHAEGGLQTRYPHPLGLIERFEIEPEDGSAQPPASFEERVLVPTEEGEGLVVYAWLDLDGDGELCGLDGEGVDEPAGLIELGEFPAHELEFELSLDATCTGPEGLYP